MKLRCSSRTYRVALLLAAVALFFDDSRAAFSPPGELVVVTDDSYPPYLFRTDAGQLQGIVKQSLADEFRQTSPLYVARFHWAVLNGRADLRDFIQRGFERITAQELQDIEARWLGHPLWLPIDTEYFYYFATAVAGILLATTLLIVWNRTLSLRVSAKTVELRTALESVQMHEQRFRQMVRRFSDATVVTSVADGRVIEANDAFCRMAGRQRDAVVRPAKDQHRFS